MSNHIEIGRKGERIAKAFLIKKGYQILETNYRFKHMEIDILARFENQLIVIEVKTRQSTYLAGPEKTVTKSKQGFIIKAANALIEANEIDLETRFDIISIILNTHGKVIDHIEDAFYPSTK